MQYYTRILYVCGYTRTLCVWLFNGKSILQNLISHVCVILIIVYVLTEQLKQLKSVLR